MFQYAVGRLLADEMNVCLHVRGNNCNVDLPAMFPNVRYDIERGTCSQSAAVLKIEQPIEPWDWPDIGPVDLRKVQEIAQGRTIRVDGYFESFVHLEPFAERLRTIYHRPVTQINRIAVHQRLGDVAHSKGNGADYIHAAAKKTVAILSVESMPVVLVSEEANHRLTAEMRETLQRETGGAVELLAPADIRDAFDEVRGSRHQILTNSTWTWWAGFLGAPFSRAHVLLSERQPARFRNSYLFGPAIPENFEIEHIPDPAEFYAFRDEKMRLNSARRKAREAAGQPF
jgi:hypothetical protein